MLFGMYSCDEAPLPPVNPEENEDPDQREEASPEVKRINFFIEDVMEDVYLWYDQLPNIDPRFELNSKEYFDKLLYSEDRWSFVTEDAQALEESFEGIEKTYGWSLTFGRFSNTGDLFAIVEFVYPNTPAEAKGFKRGDILVEIGGQPITENNYRQLLNGNSLNITMGIDTEQGIAFGREVDLVAQKLELDPVLIKDVIDYEGHKVGYLFYAQYIGRYNNSLDSAFQYFQDEGVTDLVLDLRYNPGGGTDAAEYLCSSIAPLGVVDGKRMIVSFRWNDKYQQYWNDNNYKGQLGIYFSDTTKVKMGLDRVHILTGGGTASASELTITGLDAYMDVITIGESTYGKYTASITLKPEDIYYDYKPNYYEEFKNWAVQPIILRYANSNGVTDFKNGFTPDIFYEERIIGSPALGDPNEPLLKLALEDIAGTSTTAMKSVQRRNYTVVDRGFSKFDRNKRELLLEGNLLLNSK